MDIKLKYYKFKFPVAKPRNTHTTVLGVTWAERLLCQQSGNAALAPPALFWMHAESLDTFQSAKDTVLGFHSFWDKDVVTYQMCGFSKVVSPWLYSVCRIRMSTAIS